MNTPPLLLEMLGLFHHFDAIPQVFVLLTLTEDFYKQLCLSQMSFKIHYFFIKKVQHQLFLYCALHNPN